MRIKTAFRLAALSLLILLSGCNAPPLINAQGTPWPTISAFDLGPTDTASVVEVTAESPGGDAATMTPVLGPTDVPTLDTPQTHIVLPGETLAQIAAQYGVSVAEVVAANNISDPDHVEVGAVLIIPAGGGSGTGSASSSDPPPNIPTPLSPTDNALAPWSVDALTVRFYDSGPIVKEARLSNVGAYEQWSISYPSDGIYVTGLMNIPVGDGPFPVAILLHGGIDQSAYSPGDDTASQADYLARNGYLTIAPDYRSYNNTEGTGSPLKIPWAIDTMSLIAALPTLPEADPARIGVMGHSRGGGIAEHVMVISQQVKAVVLYAPLNTDETINWNLYSGLGATWPGDDAAIYGSPTSNPVGYDIVSPSNYLDRITMPVQIHHGTQDNVLPVQWSRDLNAALQGLGKTVEYYEYPSASHTFYGADYDTLMSRTVAFFDTYVR